MLVERAAENGNFLYGGSHFHYKYYYCHALKMVKRMNDKPFRTYEELIEKLRDEKKMTIDPGDEDYVISLLKKYSYFSLVSGYKGIFKAQDGTYFPGTTINDILALYKFDDILRDTFFHAIQIIEKNIKSLLSYSFTEKYGDEQWNYITPSNFDALAGTKDELVRQKEIKKLISTFISIVTPPSNHNYIKHQWNRHQNVPLWVSIKAMTFGNTSKMFSLCHPAIQSSVAREFQGVSPDALAGMLDMLTLVRNVCAHNERLFDFSVSKFREIQDMPIHAKLGIRKNPAGSYKQGKKDLFASLICFKYLLCENDFSDVTNRINDTIITLTKETKMIPPNKIISTMGFPLNWLDLKKLDR